MRPRIIQPVFIALLLACACANAEVIGFTGPYAPATWTTTILGSPTQGAISATATTLDITGGNAGCIGGTAGALGPCEIRYVTANIDSPFSFHWAYTTADTRSAADDLFGIIVNGARTVLIDPLGAATQSGDVVVSALTTFGWFMNCTDCTSGAAVATITNFHAGAAASNLPEPSGLIFLSLAAAAGLGRRRAGSAA